MSVAFDFHGKKALVTGASQGLGYGIAIALAESGATVVALARNEAKLEELRKKHSNITVVVADVTASESTLSSLLAPHQPFHLLVNNAGVGMLEPCLEISEEAINKQFDVNLKAPIVLSKIVAKEMVQHSVRGAMVNISSQASMRPIDHHTIYCASKAGLHMATRCLAKELGEHGIRVNCVNPTVVMTEVGKTSTKSLMYSP
ncbi:oxidoreductase, short chain dehydrogenase/reductase family protein [Teladorsagia circumcincta]|uniref:Oxidoreductase, short chain dehydrogenase/reductase family protein n=1 Tax=Teladorsagia circumcincta TaxID=45464 RepID=A0A2G9UGY4_TELCI|nr:oxidoreductase, short chain dehydrogenase/reductase family protein [Teladorsagia circumcincta]